MITSHTKSEFNQDSLMHIRKTINAYKNYKKCFKFPQGIKGLLSQHKNCTYFVHKTIDIFHFKIMNGKMN